MFGSHFIETLVLQDLKFLNVLSTEYNNFIVFSVCEIGVLYNRGQASTLETAKKYCSIY